MSINPTNRDPHKETTMTNTNAATAPAWEFGGLSIDSETAHLSAQLRPENASDTAASPVWVNLSQNTDGDLVVELSVPTGYCHVAEITETGLRIVVADIGTDCCRHCGEHFSNPHIPGCPPSDS